MKLIEFIAALRTGGGRIFVLLLVFLSVLAAGVLLVYFPPSDNKVAVASAMGIIGLLSASAGGLFLSLRGDNPSGSKRK